MRLFVVVFWVIRSGIEFKTDIDPSLTELAAVLEAAAAVGIAAADVVTPARWQTGRRCTLLLARNPAATRPVVAPPPARDHPKSSGCEDARPSSHSGSYDAR